MHPLRTEVGARDGPKLKALVDAVEAGRRKREVALALSRFNNAYERHNADDALIDLWVAFEALLVPEEVTELSYRAALRIGRLAGSTAADRQRAQDIARRSYKYRSKVVHGARSLGTSST